MPILPLTAAVADTVAADSTANKAIHEQIFEFAEKVTTMPVEDLISWAFTGVASILANILLAVVIYFVGRWIIKRIKRVMQKAFAKNGVETTLEKFIYSLTSIVLNVILIFTIIGVLGINTTSFVAIFASAGLAIGMALSGTLQNFAGGVLILFLKPYKVGDVIEAQGYLGTVKEISLFSTLINTIDNKQVIVPNGPLSTGSINNFSKEPTRRPAWTFGVAYGSDYTQVEAVIRDVVSKHPLVKSDEEIFIALTSLGNSSVDITVRAWCDSVDYWTVLFDINEQIYARFNKEGISFPFPQMDVHLHNK